MCAGGWGESTLTLYTLRITPDTRMLSPLTCEPNVSRRDKAFFSNHRPRRVVQVALRWPVLNWLAVRGGGGPRWKFNQRLRVSEHLSSSYFISVPRGSVWLLLSHTHTDAHRNTCAIEIVSRYVNFQILDTHLTLRLNRGSHSHRYMKPNTSFGSTYLIV